jgi:hypothetical protein
MNRMSLLISVLAAWDDKTKEQKQSLHKPRWLLERDIAVHPQITASNCGCTTCIAAHKDSSWIIIFTFHYLFHSRSHSCENHPLKGPILWLTPAGALLTTPYQLKNGLVYLQDRCLWHWQVLLLIMIMCVWHFQCQPQMERGMLDGTYEFICTPGRVKFI